MIDTYNNKKVIKKVEEEKLYFVKNDNAIYCEDNLKVFKYFPNECIDLIYIDPPFFSGKNYDITFKDPIAVKEYGLEKETKNGYKAIIFKDMFDGKLSNYLTFMTKRIKGIYKVLKSTGSFYLHCDYHANAHLRILCDKIFGGWDEEVENKIENKKKYIEECIEKGQKYFKREIIWFYKPWTSPKNNWAQSHNTILYYTKSNKFTFNRQYDEREGSSLKAVEKAIKRGYSINNLTNSNRQGLIIYDYEKVKNDNIDISKYKVTDRTNIDPKKISARDVWSIQSIHPSKMLFPTQKPEKLLERIILASSNPGDIVADFFCGCGTTLSIAKDEERNYIGVDKSPTACMVMVDRVKYPRNKIYGLKNSIDQMKDDLDWKTFQIWAVTAIGGKPHSKKQEMGIKKEGEVKKEISAKGLDGILKAVKTNFNEDVPIEVKKHEKSIGVLSIRNFADKIRERKLHNGIFISASRLSSGAKERIESLRDEGINILLITFDDLISPNLKLKLKNYGIFKSKGDRTADLRDFV